jgi:WD40 repeat protein
VAGADHLRAYSASDATLLYELPSATPLLAARFTPGGREMITAAGNEAAIFAYAGPEAVANLTGHEGPVYGVAYSPDGATVASCSGDQSIRIWDLTAGTQLKALSGHTGAVYSLQFNADGKQLLSAGTDGTARLWDAAAGTELRKFASELTEGATPAPFYDAALSPNGQLVAAGGADRQIHLFSAVNGQLARTLTGHEDPIYRVLFNPTSTRLISCGHAGNLIVWNPADGAQLATVQLPAVAYHAALSPDGKRIVASCAESKAYVIELPAAAQ